ncbi:DUF58 domain-containing protein [Thiomicrorhabdus sp. zzn3]|uniref:DUF58 domain-containing protein n=1 Tax=Thiomicrorhabdus sp. zzn3 TaxID=3039775 RepID=UPI002436A588|nr:DUF58 domain-containing protein [Thiomicrorhabdus sp. zzn3]MDG6778840.1 DUF58 domain-containing protein [Thiomicrorhabdus sp. zzn3]
MRLFSWFKRRYPLSGSAFDKRLAQPLLSDQQIHQLQQDLEGLTLNFPASTHFSEALRQGEQASRFMGSGLEYEESRPYQPGDEVRRINWRLMAKTGQAYTKLYQEERQQSVFILLDQRNSMRFGTRVRLKAEQALRAAGYFAWLAEKSALPVEGAYLAENLQFTPSFEGRSSFLELMHRFSQSCPPLSSKINLRSAASKVTSGHTFVEPSLDDVLMDLLHRLLPGSRLIVVSDFHDLTDTTLRLLTELQHRVSVKAVWIEDQAERSLPSVSGMRLYSSMTDQAYELGDASQLEDYRLWAEHYFESRQQKLRQTGMRLYSLATHQSLEALAAQVEQSDG